MTAADPTTAPSWWMKYLRAQEHRREAEAIIAAATVEQPIRIERAQLDDGSWDYTVHHDATIDPSLPVVLGDLLFDLRSALDHIAAANRKAPTTKTPFPLFHDPIGGPRAPGEPKHLDRYRQTWAVVRANTEPAVFALMNQAQPFNAPSGTAPTNTALAILNDLQNRDKHAHVTVITSGIADIQSWVVMPDGSHIPIPDPDVPEGIFPNGVRLFHDERELQIESRGRVQLAVAAGPTGEYRALPDVLEGMSAEVGVLLAEIEKVMS